MLCGVWGQVAPSLFHNTNMKLTAERVETKETTLSFLVQEFVCVGIFTCPRGSKSANVCVEVLNCLANPSPEELLCSLVLWWATYRVVLLAW